MVKKIIKTVLSLKVRDCAKRLWKYKTVKARSSQT